MKTTQLDRIITSAPTSKTAALATGKGVHWEPDHTPSDSWQDLPLPLVPVAFLPPGMLKAGQTFGRITVVGYGGRSHHCARYVVRCTCGRYGYRIAKGLTKPKSRDGLMCDKCAYLEEMKRGEKMPPAERAQRRLRREEVQR